MVKLQEDIGLQVDHRRRVPARHLFGFVHQLGHFRRQRRSDRPGRLDAVASHGHRMARRIPKVVDRIEWKGPQNAGDFRFLKSLTSRTPKITLPGPCYIHYRAGRRNISRDVYPDLDDVLVGPGRGLSSRDALARPGRLQLSADRRDLADQARRPARARLAGGARRRLARSAAHLYRRHQRGGRGRAGRHDDRDSHLPQPGPELAGRRRLRCRRPAAVQRHECRHLFSRIRQCARRNADPAALRFRPANSWCSVSSRPRSRSSKRSTISSAGSRMPAATCGSTSCA